MTEKHATRGDLCLTVYLGWRIEDDDEVFRVVVAAESLTSVLGWMVARRHV